MEWYYYSQGQQTGPITEDALREAARMGRLQPGDHVWNPSIGEQWVEARSVPGLFASSPLALQPIPTPVMATPVVEAAVAQGPVRISCWDSGQRALEKTKAILFRPFALGKWFALGFSAWLATLGQGGGSFGGGGDIGEKLAAESGNDPAVMLDLLHQKFLEHATVILGVGSVVVLFAIAFGILFLWLRSRGKFIFLNNVVNDRTEISRPWQMFKQHGHSLFLWNLVFALIGLAVLALLVLALVFSIFKPLLHGQSFGGLWPAVALNAVVWVVVGIVFGYIARFLEDFVVPIMYNEDKTATEAWTKFVVLFQARPGAFLWYGVCYALWSVVASVWIVAVLLLTCCLAGCLMLIPYVGTVVVLPVIVFLRCLSLEYLGQYGAEFRMKIEDEG